MDYKKTKTNPEAVTRNVTTFDELTGNLYETIAALSKRSNQISAALKEEIHSKISEFSTSSAYSGDSLDEVHENREQIEIAKYYEQLPKPTLIAIQEMLDGELCFKRPVNE